MKEIRRVKALFNKSGGVRDGATMTRVTIPADWAKRLQLDKDNRDLNLTFENGKITIESLKGDVNMKKYMVIDGNSTISHTEFNSLESAKEEILNIYEKLGKYGRKDLQTEEYKLYIEILDTSNKIEDEEELEDQLILGFCNEEGYRIIDTINWKEVVEY